MPQALTYPGVYVEEVPSGVRTITGVATSIGLFIGWAARGSTTKAVRIFSFADYEREFGGLDSRTPLGYSVRHFFDNGGSDAYVIRVVTIADGSTGARPGVVGITGSALTFTATSPGVWSDKYGVRYTPHTADRGCEQIQARGLAHHRHQRNTDRGIRKPVACGHRSALRRSHGQRAIENNHSRVERHHFTDNHSQYREVPGSDHLRCRRRRDQSRQQ